MSASSKTTVTIKAENETGFTAVELYQALGQLITNDQAADGVSVRARTRSAFNKNGGVITAITVEA